jgi:hypothetical protein
MRSSTVIRSTRRISAHREAVAERLRRCGGKALLGAAALENHHRLRGLGIAQDVKQPAPVLGGFDVHADYFCLRVGQVELEQVGRRDVGAVADGDQS